MKMDSIVKILDPKESDLKYLGKFMGDENCAYDTTSILKQLRLDPIYLGISLFIIILCMGGTFIFYPNRDLYI